MNLVKLADSRLSISAMRELSAMSISWHCERSAHTCSDSPICLWLVLLISSRARRPSVKLSKGCPLPVFLPPDAASLWFWHVTHPSCSALMPMRRSHSFCYRIRIMSSKASFHLLVPSSSTEGHKFGSCFHILRTVRSADDYRLKSSIS